MSSPTYIATNVPGLLSRLPRMRELTIDMLNRCEYVILDRDNYLRGIDDPSLEIVKDKNVIFVRAVTFSLDSFEDLKRNTRYSTELDRVLTSLAGKEIVILNSEFFEDLESFAKAERDVADLTEVLANKVNHTIKVNI